MVRSNSIGVDKPNSMYQYVSVLQLRNYIGVAKEKEPGRILKNVKY